MADMVFFILELERADAVSLVGFAAAAIFLAGAGVDFFSGFATVFAADFLGCTLVFAGTDFFGAGLAVFFMDAFTGFGAEDFFAGLAAGFLAAGFLAGAGFFLAGGAGAFLRVFALAMVVSLRRLNRIVKFTER